MVKRHHLANLLLLAGVWLGVALARHALAERQLVDSGGRRLAHGRLVEVESERLVVAWRDDGGQTRVAAAASATIPGVGHRLAVGQRVFVATGGDQDQSRLEVVGLVREGHLLYLLGLFLSLFVLVGGPQAYSSVFGLVAALAGTILLLVPLMVAGLEPLRAVMISAVVLLLLLALSISGFRRRTLAIVLGGLGGLLATGWLAWLATDWLRLSGVHSTFTQDLWHATRSAAGFDFRALLRAGILFGALGVIVDLATGVAASVFEVADVDRQRSPLALALAGLRVGRDVMSTEINTLVFAHVGAQVGLLLLPFYGPSGYELPAMQILSLSDFAAEAAYVAVGTAGMILTIPLTALAAGLLAGAGRARQLAPAAVLRPARRGRAWLLAVALWTVAAVVAGQFYARGWHRYRRGAGGATVAELVRAVVVDATPAELGGRPTGERSQAVRVRLLTGSAAGREMAIRNPLSGYPGHDRPAGPGGLFLVKTMVSGGERFGAILDYDRGPALLWLGWGLGLLVLLIGGWLGVKALAALLLCAPLLGLGMYLVVAGRLPALPVLAAISLCICLLVFWLLAGCSRKALVAAGGAFGGIAVGGAAAAIASSAMAFSGLQSPSLFAIRMFGGLQGELDFAGLLAAGILLGIVGVAMDVSIAVASAAEEIAAAGASGRRELWQRGMNVGRKILCTMVLALMFAYLGANLPLLLLPSFVADISARQAINSELFAAEILRLLAGGIGVVVAIPASALLSILFQHRLPQPAKESADVQAS